MTRHNSLYRMVLSSMFLALAMLLPFLAGQLEKIGNMLCPMHLPVLLCGFFCGWQWGAVLGLAAPLLRSLLFGMPVLFPMAVCMSLELGCYGFLSGFLYRYLPQKRSSVYLSLVIAMVAGRLLWGGARFLCVGLDADQFGFAAFWSDAVVTAIPGILIQLLLIPPLVILLKRKSPRRNW
ncbi:MAG: ECF transporter S component [Clostridia bacterium]|nr:ECF transporter S component [Clostridia bacterium]